MPKKKKTAAPAALEEYKAKRDFAETPEPAPAPSRRRTTGGGIPGPRETTAPTTPNP